MAERRRAGQERLLKPPRRRPVEAPWERFLLWWRASRLRKADALYVLQLRAYDSGMNPDISVLRWRYDRLERAANALKKEGLLR